MELYLRTLPVVLGERDEMAGPERFKQLVGDVAREFTDTAVVGIDWIESQLKQFPLRYLYGTAPKRIAAHLGAIRRLKTGEALVEDSFNEALGICEYTVITHDNLTPGIVSKIAGVMASQGLQIQDAQITTREDGIVVNTIQATDPDFAGAPPAERGAEIAETIIRVLKGEEAVERLMSRNTRLFRFASCLPLRRRPRYRSITRPATDPRSSMCLPMIRKDFVCHYPQYLSTRFVGRSSSDLDQTDDDIQQSLRTGGRHQVADVFYVTDRQGTKIEDPARLETIRSTVKEDIDRFMDRQVGASERVATGSPS